MVCSAVSALVLTYLGGIESSLSGIIEGEVGEGVCNVRVTVPEHHEIAFRSISQVFLYGFERLAQTYPTFITIEKI